MIYIANCYVGQYKPGEVFDADIPEKELERLIAKKAIIPTNKTFQEVLAENGIDDATEGTDAEQNNNAADDPDDGADEAEEEADTEDAEAPEIDVMDGISAADEAEAEEVKPKGRRNRK